MDDSIELVRAVYRAFNERDLEALAELITSDYVMDWSQSMGPLKGLYRGIKGAEEWSGSIDESFESFAVEPVEFAGSAETLVTRTQVKATGRGSGVSVEAAGGTVWELRNGRVARMTLYQGFEEALEAVGLS